MRVSNPDGLEQIEALPWASFVWIVNSHARSRPSGGYLMSNNPNFNPNVGSTTDWRLFKVAEK